jgi:anti-sigma B factor antagonist
MVSNADRAPPGPAEHPALRTGTERGSLVAVLAGALDIASAQVLREQLLGLLSPAGAVVLDMSLVTSVDIGGLAVLVGAGRRARQLGGSLRLAAVTPEVAEAVRAAGLDQQLASYPSVLSAAGT